MATASALSTTYTMPGIGITDNFTAVLAAGLDEVYTRELTRPSEGMQFFRNQPMNKAEHKHQSTWGLGVAGQSNDAENLPYDDTGLGFPWTLSANTFRKAISIEKELEEDELYGVIADRQSKLVRSMTLSKELVMADVFNRGLGASGAPFVCEDGMYFIDDERPSGYHNKGLWSNLEAASAITPTSLYTAELNFAANTDDRGQLAPLVMQKIIVRPTDVKTVWEILESDLRPTDAMNAKNYNKGRFEMITYHHLTTASIFYMAGDASSPENELKFGDRKTTEVETWLDGSNPDIRRQRVRARFGVGCGQPTLWRGGTVS